MDEGDNYKWWQSSPYDLAFGLELEIVWIKICKCKLNLQKQ